MKSTRIISLLVFTVFSYCICFPVLAYTQNSSQLSSIDLQQKLITVEDLGADFHTASKTIVVSAKIKNVSRSFLRGYATIYLLSHEGEELFSYQEPVNNGDIFKHGTTVNFEASTYVPDVSKVGSISVAFTRN